MIIYTVITKEDCPVPKQPYFDSKYKYICFHSVDLKKEKPWTYVKIKDEKNPYYTFNKYKILCPFKESLYIDGKIVLTKSFYNMFDSIKEQDIIVNTHPFRDSFLDEIVDWLLLPVFSYEEALDFIIDIKNTGYPFNSGRAYLTNFLYRNNVDDFNIMWWSFWLKFEKRNQLSFFLADYFLNKKIYINTHDFISCNQHQKYMWTNEELLKKNFKKLKNFEKDLKKIGIEYKINKEIIKNRKCNDRIYR